MRDRSPEAFPNVRAVAIGLAGLAFGVSLCVRAGASAEAPAAHVEVAQSSPSTGAVPPVLSHRRTIDRYCVTCHNQKLKTAGLTLDEADVANPEVFSFFETGFPLQRRRALIGTQDWEFALGTGVVRGFSWGTVTLRGTIANDAGSFEPGEYALEYLRRLSDRFRVYAGIEGTQDESELITEAQVFLTPNIFLKLNNAFGVTSKAPDWAPEIGVMFSIPTR